MDYKTTLDKTETVLENLQYGNRLPWKSSHMVRGCTVECLRRTEISEKNILTQTALGVFQIDRECTGESSIWTQTVLVNLPVKQSLHWRASQMDKDWIGKPPRWAETTLESLPGGQKLHCSASQLGQRLHSQLDRDCTGEPLSWTETALESFLHGQR